MVGKKRKRTAEEIAAEKEVEHVKKKWGKEDWAKARMLRSVLGGFKDKGRVGTAVIEGMNKTK